MLAFSLFIVWISCRTKSRGDLTHWGRLTHICVNKLTIIGSDNGLSPDRHQAIIWTNAGILSIGPLGTKLSEILIAIHIFSFKKMHLKMLSGKWRPCCLGLNVLRHMLLLVLFTRWVLAVSENREFSLYYAHFATGTEVGHKHAPRCHQRPQHWHHENSVFSVVGVGLCVGQVKAVPTARWSSAIPIESSVRVISDGQSSSPLNTYLYKCRVFSQAKYVRVKCDLKLFNSRRPNGVCIYIYA